MALEKFTIWREANEEKSSLTTAQETAMGKLAKMSMSNLRDLNDMQDFLTEVLKVIMEKTNKDPNTIGRVLTKLKADIQKMGHNI